MPAITLDAGGLVALDRSDRRVLVLLARARETSARVTIPPQRWPRLSVGLIGRSGSPGWSASRLPTSSRSIGWTQRMSAGCSRRAERPTLSMRTS
jgi:hypothetical protein